MRRYGKLVYSIAVRSGLSPEDGDDVFQIVFTQVYRSLGLLDHPEAFAGWLSTIARRESWRFKRRAEPEVESAAVSNEASSVSADESIERTEQRFQVERGLEQLDDRCKRLLTLLFFSDPAPSYDDIAEQLGMSAGSVGPTRGRCLEKLKRILRRMGF